MPYSNDIQTAITQFEYSSCSVRKKKSEKYLLNLNKLMWACISSRFTLSEEFLYAFRHKLRWDLVSMYQILNERVIERFKTYVSWVHISKYQTLSADFMWRFRYELDWSILSYCQQLPEELIRKMQFQVDFMAISFSQRNLSTSFINEYKEVLCWDFISSRQKNICLDHEFIKEHIEHINWYKLCRFQTLSEKFIRAFKHHLNWKHIFLYQNVSDSFIWEVFFPYVETSDKVSCSICLSPIASIPVKLKNCNHSSFCRDCLDIWLAEQNTCPLCRTIAY